MKVLKYVKIVDDENTKYVAIKSDGTGEIVLHNFILKVGSFEDFEFIMNAIRKALDDIRSTRVE